MGFVKTKEEVARIRAVLKQPRFVASEMLMVEFLNSARHHQVSVAAGL